MEFLSLHIERAGSTAPTCFSTGSLAPGYRAIDATVNEGPCMHIQRIDGAETSFLQALVRFPDLPASEPWWASYKRRMLAIPALGDITSAYRLNVREDCSIDR